VLWQYVAKLAAAVYWFHPLVWLAIWCMHIERELACDDAVIYHGHSPEHYASTLLELAAGIKSRNKALPACAVAMARKNIVKQRIVSILNPKLNRKPLGRVKTFLLGVIGLSVIVLVASLTLFGKAKPVGFLNLDAMTNDHTVKGELNGQVIDVTSDMAKTMARVTGKKWYRSNSLLKLGINNNMVTGEIRVFSAGTNKPLFSGSSWYRITVDDGVLVEAASEKGFNKAAEHFAELIEFEDNRPRIAKGEYTAWHRKKTLTREDTMSLTAIRSDAEKVKITGQIVMPDGKPVRNIEFDVRDFAVMRGNDGHYSYGSGCAVSRPDGYSMHTDDNGQFEFEVIPGCILIVGVYRDPVDGNLISDPICFTPDYFSNQQPLNIKLQPGVPVTVRAKHEDGSPVEGVTVGWIRPYPSPIKTYGDTNIDGNCNTQVSKPLTDGEITFYLAPGEYELNVRSNSYLYFDVPKKLTVIEGGHYEFEHTIPNPARVRLLQVNDDPLVNREIKLMHVGQKQEGRPPVEIVEVRTDANGIVPVYLWDESNYVFATSEDERFGMIKKLSRDDAGKTIDITLERSTEFLAHIRNRNTQKPVANKEFQCQIGIATLGTVRHGHVTFANKFKTNNDGAARFYLPPIPEGDPYLEYEPLLSHPLDVRQTESIIIFTINTTGDDSSYEPLPEPENDEKTETPPHFIEVRGQVTYPDGSPGKDLFLTSVVCSASKHLWNTETTDSNGYYHVKVPEDGYFAIIANQQQGRENGNERATLSFASPVVSAYIGESSPDVVERNIVLEKGIPLHGRLTYENGEPAVGKEVFVNVYPFGRQAITFGKGAISSGSSVNIGINATSNEQGEYVFLLTPGEYVVSQSDQFGEDIKRTITIRAEDDDHVLDFVVPPETTGTVLRPDGSPAANVNIWRASITGKQSAGVGSTQKTDTDGNFRLQLTPFGNLLTFYTEDKSLGRVVYLDGDERLAHQTVTLAAPEIGRLRFISEDTGKPIAGLGIGYAPRLERSSHTTIGGMPQSAETDNDGYVELSHLFIGGIYNIGLNYELQRQNAARVTQRLTPSRPGDTVDYGEIEIRGDFTDFEPKP